VKKTKKIAVSLPPDMALEFACTLSQQKYAYFTANTHALCSGGQHISQGCSLHNIEKIETLTVR
jgi:hypothetical protein